jgi:uncharacterized membrane protein
MQETGAGHIAETGSHELFDATLNWISLVFEAAGIGAIVVGAIVAALTFVMRRFGGGSWDEAYHLFRTSLARGILLGLEFLVAADIIGTVAVEPTLENLYVLGVIVLIRTFLSFSLGVEIEGRLPWQKAPDSDRKNGHP